MGRTTKLVGRLGARDDVEARDGAELLLFAHRGEVAASEGTQAA